MGAVARSVRLTISDICRRVCKARSASNQESAPPTSLIIAPVSAVAAAVVVLAAVAMVLALVAMVLAAVAMVLALTTPSTVVGLVASGAVVPGSVVSVAALCGASVATREAWAPTVDAGGCIEMSGGSRVGGGWARPA